MFVLQNVFASAPCSTLISQYAAVADRLASRRDKDKPLRICQPVYLDDGGIDEPKTVRLYAEEAGALLGVPDSEAEGIFGLLLALIYSSAFAEPDLLFELIALVLASIQKTPSERAHLKIRLLALTFNALVPECALRATALVGMLAVARAAGKPAISALIGNQFVHALGEVVQALAVPQTERLALLGKYAASFAGAQQLRAAYLVYVALLESIVANVDETPNASANACSAFAGALLCGLAAPGGPGSADLSDLAAVAANIDTARVNLPGAGVLTAYISGDVQGLAKSAAAELAAASKALTSSTAYWTSSNDAMPAPAPTPMQIAEKARMVRIASLSGGKAISYDELAQLLDCGAKDVERVVLSALRAQLVSGKLNPVDRIFVPTRAAQIHFMQAQWDQLSEALQMWSCGLKNVDAAIDSIGSSASLDRFDDGEAQDFEGLIGRGGRGFGVFSPDFAGDYEDDVDLGFSKFAPGGTAGIDAISDK